MPQDNVLRFVSLRAPVAREDTTTAAREAIVPGEGDTGPLDEAIARAYGDGPEERIRHGASTFVAGSDYFTHRLGDNRVGWFREAAALVADVGVDAVAYRQRAESLLDQAKPPAEGLPGGWQSPELGQQVWSSYLAALLLGEEYSRDTRGLLAVLRLRYGHRRATEGDFDAGSLGLASRRAAVPAHYLVPRSGLAPGGADSTAPAEPAPQAPGNVQVAAAAALDLLAARAVLLAAAARRQKRLIAESLERLREQANQGAAAPHPARPGPTGEEPISIPPAIPNPTEKLHELTAAELDPTTVATLERFGLDPTHPVAALTQQLDALIAAKFVESTRIGGSQLVAWQSGAFVRVHKPTPLGAASPGTPEAAK